MDKQWVRFFDYTLNNKLFKHMFQNFTRFIPCKIYYTEKICNKNAAFTHEHGGLKKKLFFQQKMRNG